MIDLRKYRQLLDADPELRARYDESVERHQLHQQIIGALISWQELALNMLSKLQVGPEVALTRLDELIATAQQLSNPLQETEIP